MIQRIDYNVETFSQVLLSGSWENGEWDWERFHIGTFKSLEDATKCINKIKIDNDTPIARIYKETRTWGEDGWDVTTELITERS